MTIFAANESAVLVDGEPIQGVQGIEYRRRKAQTNVYAVGAAERIGVVGGPISVEGRIRVASTSPVLDQRREAGAFLQVTAQLRRGEESVTVAFDEVRLTEKSFEMTTGGHGESVYSFTATRVREGE